MSATLKIENKTDLPLIVKVTDNPDWVLADIAGEYLKALVVGAFSGGGGSLLASQSATVIKVMNAINTARDVYNVYSKVERFYRLAKAADRIVDPDRLDALRQAIHKDSITVAPGDTKVVNTRHRLPFEGVDSLVPAAFREALQGKSGDGAAEAALRFVAGATVEHVDNLVKGGRMAWNAWDRLKPSTIASFFSGASDCTVFLTQGDYSRSGSFNANSDAHWIVGSDKDQARATYLFRKGDHSAAAYFTHSTGTDLMPGECLEPWDSLDTRTRNFDPLKVRLPSTQTDSLAGEVAISAASYAVGLVGVPASAMRGMYEWFVRPAVNTATEVAACIGSSHTKLLFTYDGELRFVHGTAKVWGNGTMPGEPGRVTMQEDGNLVISRADGTPVRSLWEQAPEGYAGSFVRLKDDGEGTPEYVHASDRSCNFLIHQHTWYVHP